jgi:hypothetical protein
MLSIFVLTGQLDGPFTELLTSHMYNHTRAFPNAICVGLLYRRKLLLPGLSLYLSNLKYANKTNIFGSDMFKVVTIYIEHEKSFCSHVFMHTCKHKHTRKDEQFSWNLVTKNISIKTTVPYLGNVLFMQMLSDGCP